MDEDDNPDNLDSVKNGFQSFEHAAADIVLAASFNSSGTRIAVCSADHKIRVYDTDAEDSWVLTDLWRGHDAEILDARLLPNPPPRPPITQTKVSPKQETHTNPLPQKIQWLPSLLGQFIATIGGDNKFKLWREDHSQLPKSGRCFRCIFSQSPPTHVSYVSFGSKALKNDIYLAMITHDGLLSLLEPVDAESLTAWTQIDTIYPFGHHPRGTEVRFRISFQQSEGPCSNALLAGMGSKTLSLAVSAMNGIKILRAVKPDEASSSSSSSSEGNYQFYEMHDMHTDTALINEIAWAPGCLRPFDVIAAACDDGTVRIFEVDTPHHDAASTSKSLAAKPLQQSLGLPTRGPSFNTRNAPSGIGAGLAGMSRDSAARRGMAHEVKHESRQVAVLAPDEPAPVWKVRWLHDGSALASTGDNGKVHLWRESLSGEWIEFAETEPA